MTDEHGLLPDEAEKLYAEFVADLQEKGGNPYDAFTYQGDAMWPLLCYYRQQARRLSLLEQSDSVMWVDIAQELIKNYEFPDITTEKRALYETAHEVAIIAEAIANKIEEG